MQEYAFDDETAILQRDVWPEGDPEPRTAHTNEPYAEHREGGGEVVQDPEAIGLHETDQDVSDVLEIRGILSSVHLAPRSGTDAITWLKEQRTAGRVYPRECLILQRSARGIPALAPTAYAASQAVPESERVTKVADWRRGMVGFSKGSDPAGHIFCVLGRLKGHEPGDHDGVLCFSNDVVEGHYGALGVVRLSFFEREWGHKILFAGTWLNGYDFADFNQPPKATTPNLGENYRQAIASLEKAVKAHKSDKDSTLYNALKHDLERMKSRYEKYHKS